VTLEEIIEARLAGTNPEVPTDVRNHFGAALSAHDALAFAVGETIGWAGDENRPPPELPADYEILRELGRGGMGVVYLARQKSLGREIAVKVLRLNDETRDRFVRRFLDEAKHMAQLRHPNIVPVHEVGQAESEPYFTMEFVPGESLAAKLSNGPLSPAQATAILKQATAGVQHAHEQGIIHRDLKPGNILLDSQGRAFVTDFGLARDVDGGSELTRPGELLGTPAYMAPEQARGESRLIGEASDVHALGAILYESLIGTPPFGHDSPAAVFARLLNNEPTPPRAADRRIPRDLETICLKCLMKDPSRRYPTARALLEDLRRFEAGEPITAKRPSLLDRSLRFAKRQWKLGATAVVTGAVVLALAVNYFDKDRSVATLRSWGQERERSGDHAGAVEVYSRAWAKATDAEKETVKDDLIRCAKSTTDPKAAIAAAREVLAVDPYASFGPHDFLIAQSVVAELRAKNPGRGLGNVPVEQRDALQLVERRLKVFLHSGTGTAEEREDAERSLSAVAHALTDRPPTPLESIAIENIYPLPTGSIDELKRLAADESQTLWRRGMATFALAKKLDGERKRDEAKRAAVAAFDLMRKAYPIYQGAARSVVIAGDGKSRIGDEAPEAKLLRDADAFARKLDPRHPNRLRGGLRLEIVGAKFPSDVMLDVNVTLSDPSVPQDYRFLPFRRAPFQDGKAEVGVADGAYRLLLNGQTSGSGSSESGRFLRFTAIDFDRVPKSVTVNGDFQTIKIPARRLREVKLSAPIAGAAYDPNVDFLRWEPVEGAKSYHVKLAVQQDRAGARSMEFLPDVQISVQRVCLGAMNDEGAVRRMARLSSGTTGTWAVEAYDADGKVIAVSEETARPILIARSVAD
jgi:predicted Ser/Thr protein kinase